MSHTAEPQIRSLTDGEVSHFHEKGWVFLPGYLDAEYASLLREHAESYFGYDKATDTLSGHRDPGVNTSGIANDFMRVSNRDEAFKQVSFNPQTERNIQQLRPDGEGIRCLIDVAAVKFHAAIGEGCGPTNYHQDFHSFPLSQALSLTCWIALDGVTPEMGGMRFFEGSGRDDWMMTQPDTRDLDGLQSVFAAYPWLSETATVTPPITYQPGDATIHNSRIIHGAPGNSSDRPRWNYASTYVPASCRYTGSDGFLTNGLGLAVGGRLDHPNFPMLPRV